MQPLPRLHPAWTASATKASFGMAASQLSRCRWWQPFLFALAMLTSFNEGSGSVQNLETVIKMNLGKTTTAVKLADSCTFSKFELISSKLD